MCVQVCLCLCGCTFDHIGNRLTGDIQEPLNVQVICSLWEKLDKRPLSTIIVIIVIRVMDIILYQLSIHSPTC